MLELNERQYGFDAARLGFPSIAACRAIVLQTTAGLFGYHNASGHSNQAARSAEFAVFVHGHPQWAANTGLRLYVICYTEPPVTGYGSASLSEWKAEAQTFATALGFNGRRFGYSLSPAHGALSSYVRIEQAIGMATIRVAPWDVNAPYVVMANQAPGVDIGWVGDQTSTASRVAAVNIATPPLKQVQPQALD